MERALAEALKGQFWMRSVVQSLFERRSLFAVIACLALGVSIYMQDRVAVLVLSAVFCTTLFFLIVRVLTALRHDIAAERHLEVVREVCLSDPRSAILTDSDGQLLWWNSASQASLLQDSVESPTLVGALVGILPNSAPVVRRLTALALREGLGHERLFGLSGPVDIHVQEFGSSLLWRIDLMSQTIDSDNAGSAMLTIGRKGTILFMNSAAKTMIGERVTSLERLYLSGSEARGDVRLLATKNGPLSVRARKQTLQSDRYHLFLTPIKQNHDEGDFALADLPVPLLRLNLQGVVEQVNEAATTLLGRGDLNGQSMSAIFEGLSLSLEDWIAKTKTRAADAEFLRVRDQKKETFVQVVLKLIGTGDDARIVALLSDATKLKSLEAQFVQSQKMQAIGQLAGGVAHDFNNLLTAISGHCDLMLLRHDPGDQDYADLMQVHQNANRAAGLVSQLLAFSRKQTLQLEQMDIRNTLSDLTHLLNRLVGETVTLTLSHDPILKPVRADKRQLEQVIMNLVVNARDAMPNGGEITIETESMTLNAPMLRERVTVPKGDYVVVRVRDLGVGIEPDALQKIFEPFYTTKRTGEGTGLGLSTAYGIVKQTGGYIFADSQIGQGTCFSLMFPASQEQEEKRDVPAETTPARTVEKCSGVILLVEDEAPVRAFASRALSMRGFEVIEADSGEQALELLEDEALRVDVFVTDVVMPGIDGPTWVRKALKTRENVKVVFVSGYAEGAFQGEENQVPNSVFLPKPFSLTDLTATVQNQMS